MSRRTDARGGFTLVELLVSLMLLGLVLSLVYGAFAQISDAALTRRDELTEGQELRLLTRMIADDLAAAQWLQRYWDKGVGHNTGIVGDTSFESGKAFSRLSFHAARPSRFQRGLALHEDPGLHEVGYYVALDEERTRLQLIRREDFYLDDDLREGGLTVVVAEEIEVFRVEYLPPDADPNALEEPWEERWDAPNRPAKTRMPQAIRLTLTRRDAAGRTYSEVLEVNLKHSVVP